MSDHEREAMLKKFKDSGGKILNEREVREVKEEEEKEKQDSKQKYLSISTESLPSARDSLIDSAEYRSQPKKTSESMVPKRGFSDLIFLYSKCFFAGLTSISGSKVKKKFLLSITNELQRHLRIFRQDLNECLLDRGENVLELLNILEEKNPLTIEILNHIYELYDPLDFTPIENTVDTNLEREIRVDHILNTIKNLYKSFYYIRPYQRMSFQTVNEFFKLYARSKEPTEKSLNVMRKDMLAGLRMIFHHTHSLYLLICCGEKAVFNEDSDIFKELINFDKQKIIGQHFPGNPHKLARLAKKENSPDTPGTQADKAFQDNPEISQKAEEQSVNILESAQNETDLTDLESETIPPLEENADPITRTKEYQFGMSLMKNIMPDQLRTKFRHIESINELSNFDKVFLSFGYYQEFEYGYSFILTTKKIHYEIDYSHGLRKDYAKILTDLYTESRNIEKSFVEYCTLVRDFKSIQEYPMKNYIEQNRKESMLSSKLESQGITTRGVISQFLEKVISNLALLITNMKERGANGIVSNMNQPIHFEENIEGEKKLNGKTVSEAITAAYCYSLALKYRINKGDFHGIISQMDENEIKKSFGEEYYQSHAQ